MTIEPEQVIIDALIENYPCFDGDDEDQLMIVTLDARTVLARLAATGFHVVAEGQAVVDGRVWQLVPGPGRVYRLRPPTDEAGA